MICFKSANPLIAGEPETGGRLAQIGTRESRWRQLFAGEETMIGGESIYAVLMLLIMALALQAGITARANG
jgi:hypothetical protein